MEFGKDVIAAKTRLDRVCVFQLKRVDKRLTQAKWQEMLPQLNAAIVRMRWFTHQYPMAEEHQNTTVE